jgi:xylulokinase
MKLALGIDVGTSGTRALVVDGAGKLVSQATRPHAISHPRPVWSEQDPHEWWLATSGAVRAALDAANLSGSDIAAVGLSGQMHGLVMLDATNQVIRPAILWNDQRSVVECEELTEKIGAERLLQIACNPMLAGFTAPKIAWVAKHEPDAMKRARHILLPKDYVRFMLTGDFATDVSDGSGMLLMNVPERKYAPEILSVLGIDEKILPKLYESPYVTGTVNAKAAESTGLAAGTPVVGGAGDQAAAAVGNGVITEGVSCATLGTSGVIFAATDRLLVDIPKGRVHSFCHAVPGKWHVMGVVLASGGSYQWIRNNLAEVEKATAQNRGVDVYEVLSEEALSAQPGCEGLIFLPYLTGERSPINDPYARGGWIGLTMRHKKADLIRSVVEGASFAMKDCMSVIRDLGVKVTDIRLSGGGAVSPLWRSIQASVYNKPVSTLAVSEGSAYGAAILAMVGGGIYPTVEDACKSVIKVTGKTRPDKSAAAMYKKLFPIYRKAYKHLKGDFKALCDVVACRM